MGNGARLLIAVATILALLQLAPMLPLDRWLGESATELRGTPTETHYQWIDESGQVRITARLDEVPPDRRDTMGRFEVPIAPAASTARAAAPSVPDVTIYVTRTCHFCQKALAHLDREGVRYAKKDIQQDRQARDEILEVSGNTAVPVIVVGKSVIRGYDVAALDRALASMR